MTYGIGTGVGPDGMRVTPRHHSGALMKIDCAEWPPSLTISEHARVAVTGSTFHAWDACHPSVQGWGGELVRDTGERLFMADLIRATLPADDPRWATCRVYWGTHGCILRAGHDGGHECDCCTCPDHEGFAGVRFDEDDEAPRHIPNPDQVDADGWLCVGKAPYFGPDTMFYGEDVPS